MKKFGQWELGTKIPQNDTAAGLDWNTWIVCIPADAEWAMVVRNALRMVSRGRYYARDERENSIINARDTGQRIFNSMSICNFDEITDSLGSIASAIRAIELRQQLTVQCCDQLTPPAPPPGASIPLPPPGSSDPPPPAYDSPEDYQEYLCALANWVWWVYRRIVGVLAGLDTATAAVLVVVALIGVFLPEGLSTAIGGVTLITIVSAIVAYENGIEVVADLAELQADYMDANREGIVGQIYCALGRYDTMAAGVQEEVATFLAEHLPPGIAGRLASIISLGSTWLEENIENAVEFWPEPGGFVPCDCTPPPPFDDLIVEPGGFWNDDVWTLRLSPEGSPSEPPSNRMMDSGVLPGGHSYVDRWGEHDGYAGTQVEHYLEVEFVPGADGRIRFDHMNVGNYGPFIMAVDIWDGVQWQRDTEFLRGDVPRDEKQTDVTNTVFLADQEYKVRFVVSVWIVGGFGYVAP